MGENLALNIESKGFPIAVYNRSPDKVDDFMNDRAEGKQVTGFKDIPTFVDSLERPRKIVLLVKAGAPVDDAFIQELHYRYQDKLQSA